MLGQMMQQRGMGMPQRPGMPNTGADPREQQIKQMMMGRGMPDQSRGMPQGAAGMQQPMDPRTQQMMMQHAMQQAGQRDPRMGGMPQMGPASASADPRVQHMMQMQAMHQAGVNPPPMGNPAMDPRGGDPNAARNAAMSAFGGMGGPNAARPQMPMQAGMNMPRNPMMGGMQGYGKPGMTGIPRPKRAIGGGGGGGMMGGVLR